MKKGINTVVKARTILLAICLLGFAAMVVIIGVTQLNSIALKRSQQAAEREWNKPMETNIRVALQTAEKIQAGLDVAAKGANWVEFTPDTNGILVIHEARSTLNISEIVVSFPTDRFGEKQQRVFRYDAGNVVGQDASLRLSVTNNGVCLSQPGTSSSNCWEEITNKKAQEEFLGK